MSIFNLQSSFKPSIHQQQAIDQISNSIKKGILHQTLIGVTGSGKTYTMANVIKNNSKPTLVLTHNKTLAAQLYNEFKDFFPDNAVEYFVSYYDYYQPEAYVPRRDLYIEKDSSIDDNLNKLRLSATRSLFDREDVIIISSVSCIYGLGSPEAYSGMLLYLTVDMNISREEICEKLVDIRYERFVYDFRPGVFRINGDIIDIYPAYDDQAYRVVLFENIVEEIYLIDPLTGKKINQLSKAAIYPASHYVQPKNKMTKTLKMIQEELSDQLQYFRNNNKLLEAQRLEQRTLFDIEMLEETGNCPGIENYSRIMTRRNPGEAPPTLIDYFPKQSLLIIDESHVTIPQLNGMYKGDYSRKRNLVDYGFRLPSALDNRPLKFEEFEKSIMQLVYVSATPSEYELKISGMQNVVEQIIRPTGLLDPQIIIKPIEDQIDDLYSEINKRITNNERILVTTLTKRMAEDLTEYLTDLNIKVQYLHSDIDVVERSEIIRNLRLGSFDVLVGINLLREGLDIPEVSLVAILDADKEGFLRSTRSLMQTCGRAARNSNGTVIMYADKITNSMKLTIDETNRRRTIQLEHNQINNIIPQTIIKKIPHPLVELESKKSKKKSVDENDPKNISKLIIKKRKSMYKFAKALNFEQAALIRDQIKSLEDKFLNINVE